MTGMMVGAKEGADYLRNHGDRNDPMIDRIINRLAYIAEQDRGKKPKLNKGHYRSDWYTCGHCGGRTVLIHDNYCPNCGYRIRWDSTRCLTK